MEEEVLRLREVLEKESTSVGEKGDAMILLSKLVMTLAILRSTKVGRIVAKMSKEVDQPYSALASTTVAGWKKLLPLVADEEPSRVSSRPKTVVTYKEPSEKEIANAAHDRDAKDISSKPQSTQKIKIDANKEPLPKRNATTKCFHFSDYTEFTPNLSPEEVLRAGSFGGTYFRPIKSKVTGKSYGREVVDEVQESFVETKFTEAEIKRKIANPVYNNDVNTYKKKCGASLDEWESSGWMRGCDPYGWFQWYCRFFHGRRCDDDDRQVARALACMGPKGRWRTNLLNKILAQQTGKKSLQDCLDDYEISPVIRQTLQHWGYKPTLKDLESHQKTKK